MVVPTSSKTSTGSAMPRTGTGPSALTWTYPSASRRVSALSSTEAGLAICSIRAARWVVWPTAEYSIRRSLPMEPTTTSPELRPTRIWTGTPRVRCISSP